MGEIKAMGSWQKSLIFPRRLRFADYTSWQHQARTATQRQSPVMVVKNENKKMVSSVGSTNPTYSTGPSVDSSNPTYSTGISTDIPLLESPEASFDQYLEDKPRVFRAMFPDAKESLRLNEEEWRIHMSPLKFLLLTFSPVVDIRLRCKSDGKDYPDGVPLYITKVLELDILRYELHGLDDIVKPSHFSLGVKGTMYPDRQGETSLKGELQMSMSFAITPTLALLPDAVLKRVTESMLKRLLKNMKHKVNGSLLDDYSEFKRENEQTV